MTRDPAEVLSTAPWWDGIALSAEERQALQVAGYGGDAPLGNRPVLIVVDATVGFFGPRGVDLLDVVRTHPLASGEAAWRTTGPVSAVVAATREIQLPIVFTRPAPPSRRAAAVERWADKNARYGETVPGELEIVVDTGYRPDDLVLEKEAPSAFYGTPLARWITGWNADGVIICGGTTSGCVRATVVDAFSANLTVTVVADGCFDRVAASHWTGLFDMDLKYASVMFAQDLVDRLRGRNPQASP